MIQIIYGITVLILPVYMILNAMYMRDLFRDFSDLRHMQKMDHKIFMSEINYLRRELEKQSKK